MPRSDDSPSHATPPPSPPASNASATPRIKTLDFGNSLGSFLPGSESPQFTLPDIPARSKQRQRITKDSDTLRNTMLATHVYTPPESSRKVPDVVVDDGSQTDGDAESESIAEYQTSESTASSKDDEDDNGLILLQPRTYTPVPPAPTPSPRVTSPRESDELRGPGRGTPDELSIHIEAEEDMPQSPEASDVRETVLTIPHVQSRQAQPVRAQPKILQIQPVRQSRSSDKEVVLGHKTSLRDRVSLKGGDVPTAIRVPPANAYEIQRPRYQTPQHSPRDQLAPLPSHAGLAAAKHHTTNLDFSRPPHHFPNLLASPASERQHYRPVQASPHSPLQQRPHTSGTVGGHRPLHKPSQTGMSMLSSVTTVHDGAAAGSRPSTMGRDSRADSTRTVKKKRSAFGWLKKAFSLDEEERAAFEARRRAQPANYYHYQYPAHSPRYLDGKRIA